MSDSEILDHFQVSLFASQREWGVSSLVHCNCTHVWVYTECCSRCIKQQLTVGITMTLLQEILDYVPLANDTGQREWSVSSFVHCNCIHMCGCTECCSRCNTQQLTVGITMTLLHKVLDCVPLVIDTGQREWSVSSLVHCNCNEEDEGQNLGMAGCFIVSDSPNKPNICYEAVSKTINWRGLCIWLCTLYCVHVLIMYTVLCTCTVRIIIFR